MQVYKLSEIVGIVGGVFHQMFDEFSFYCKAEILNIKPYKQRCYIDFIETSSSGTIVSKAKGIVRDHSVIESFIKDTNYVSIDDIIGTEILFCGTISFHELYGWSISVHSISSEFAIGKQHKTIQEIRQSLKKSGLFEKNKRLTMGLPPYRIAIISSSTSEGLQDFVTVLHTANVPCEHTLYESTVHGNKAIDGVTNALEAIQSDLQAGKHYDVVVLIRGGGGGSGLQRLNARKIVEQVCIFPLPVIVGVGHTTDISLLDECAFHASATPTAAGEYIVEQYTMYAREIEVCFGQIESMIKDRFDAVHTNIRLLSDRISTLVKRKISHISSTIDFRYATIRFSGPKRAYQQGYATLHDERGAILSRRMIEQLVSGDTIQVKTNSRIFISNIQDIEETAN